MSKILDPWVPRAKKSTILKKWNHAIPLKKGVKIECFGRTIQKNSRENVNFSRRFDPHDKKNWHVLPYRLYRKIAEKKIFKNAKKMCQFSRNRMEKTVKMTKKRVFPHQTPDFFSSIFGQILRSSRRKRQFFFIFPGISMPKVLAPYLPRRAIEKRIFLFLYMEQNMSFSRRKKVKNDKKMCVFSPVRFPKIYKNRVENTFSEKWKKSEKFHILKIFLFSKKK